MAGPYCFDRIWETCSAPGTSATVNLLGAKAGYRAFSAIAINGDSVYYIIADQSGGANWELGTATWNTGNTLTRTAGNVLAGSAGAGTLVNFASGVQDVFLDEPASKRIKPGTILNFGFIPQMEAMTATAYADLPTPDSIGIVLDKIRDILITYTAQFLVTPLSAGYNLVNIDGTDESATNQNAVTGQGGYNYATISYVYKKASIAAGSHTVKIRHHVDPGCMGRWFVRSLEVKTLS